MENKVEVLNELRGSLKLKPQTLPESIDETSKRVKNSAIDYNDIENRARAHRHELINELIEDLREPLQSEQSSKNRYRKYVLVAFSIFFVAISVITFIIIFAFMPDGYTKNEVSVAKFLITGLFANLVGLAIIIFKYLFDDKNSLLKDMIQLVVKTIERNKVDDK